MPTADELLVDEVIDATQAEQTKAAIQEVVEFVPRAKRRQKDRDGWGVKSSGSTRYSRASKKVGDLGERLVFEYLQRRLRECGRSDLADKVTWHQESSADRTPGWDITSFDVKTGESVFVEVKASQGETVGEVILTRNEWEAAKTHGAKYCIYLVTNVLKQNPSVEVVQDPARRVADGELSVREAAWSLRL